MIPQEKIEAVTRGLRQAFGVSEFEDIRLLTGGSSAEVFRIVVNGRPYVLRIVIRSGDPTDHFTCMQAAADAGLAPRVHYTGIEDRISITDFVEAVPFSMNDALVRMPAVLRNLHALPPFPGRANHLNTSCMFLINQGPALDGFIKAFRAANLLSLAECEELFALHAQLAAAYQHQESDMVSSHNDLLRPENILFDGQRVWLVDWEAAFRNDRFVDLAVLANFVVTNESDEEVYLRAYFGQPPDEYQRARFFLMQQVSHIFYTMGFLLAGSAGKPIDWSEAIPDFKDFCRGIWAGDLNIADQETKVVYGKVHWKQLLQNMRKPRFNEAVRVVSDR